MDVVEFIKSFPLRDFSKGEVLLSADEEVDKILVIREGIVKVSSLDDQGNERLLWIAGRYDIVPTEGLFDRVTTTDYFYTAYCDGSAYVVSKDEFLEKSAQHADIMFQVARGLSEHHDDLLNRLNSVEQPNLRRKILFMLHALCVKFSGADSVKLHEIGLNLTHQDIADMVHATREATSIEMKKLLDEKLVKYTRTSFTVQAKKIAEEIETPA